MNQQEKIYFYKKAKQTLASVIESIRISLENVHKKNKHLRKELPKINEENKIVQQRLLEHGVERESELESLVPSPYFTRCVVEFDHGKEEEMYFGKFSFTDESIYSWVTPASSIRFEKTGPVHYVRPDGLMREGVLRQKDQYMISDGNIVFLATESINQDRELVYQEYFSNQKKDFILPEIVAQMEKAQDTVIRANHRGPLLISGPAGSGKTTLALHRVAFLAQSPDVSDQFSPTSIIVFVQDKGTQEYFSHLLPQLGIKGVTITTFAQWAMKVLDLQEYSYVYRYGTTESEKDMYEFRKYEALHKLTIEKLDTDIYKTLAKVYELSSPEEQSLFAQQKNEKILDRFDLTILLMLYKKEHGTLTLMQEYYQMAKSGAAKKKIGRFPVSYSLMIFDEFQNYLPEQIRLAKSTLDEKNNAVMYIGDMAQQTQFGTMKDWKEAGEAIKDTRKVILQKVYRNTKNILQYISSLGYQVKISDTLREGESVIEKVLSSQQEEIEYVRSVIQRHSGSVGILAKDSAYLEDFFELKKLRNSVYVMNMNEAQGVEFDVVCIVGIEKDMFNIEYTSAFDKYREEKKRVHKDLLYVALTRAMNSLYIVGTSSLKEVLGNLLIDEKNSVS
jgi:DNA helicase IV